MRISIHSCAKVTMTQNFLHYLSRHTHTEQECCGTVSQIMETNVRQPYILEQLSEMICRYSRPKAITLGYRRFQSADH